MKHLIFLRYFKEHFRSVSVEISDCQTRSIFKNLFGCKNKKRLQINISAVFKSYAFETRIKKNCLLLNRGFFLYHDQQAEMIRHKLFANITKNQTYNLVLFHRKVIFQVILISTSKKIQECAKIILDNMGNNEEKNRYFIKINSYRTQPSLPRRETARKHTVPELRRWHLKGVNATCHSFNRRSRPSSTILKSLLSYLLLIIQSFFALIFFVNIFLVHKHLNKRRSRFLLNSAVGPQPLNNPCDHHFSWLK